MNLLEIIIIILTVLLAVGGFRKGFVKKLASMVSLVLSLVLVSLFLPYMTDFLKNNTPVYDYIQKQCEKAVTEYAADSLVSGKNTGTGTQADEYRSMGREQIKSLMEQYGYDSQMVDALDDEQLEAYKEQFIEDYLEQYLGTSGDSSGQTLGKIEQTEVIENLPLPQVVKDLLLDYNNDEGYDRLSVSNFQEYLISFLASAILNVISFIAAVLVVQLLLWAVIGALNLLASIPVIRVVNRVAGLGLGLLQALFLIWLFFLILSMLSATDAGLYLMSMVQESEWLGALYDSNLFLNIVLRGAAIFS